MRKLKKYKPTPFMAEGSHYDKAAADYLGECNLGPKEALFRWQG